MPGTPCNYFTGAACHYEEAFDGREGEVLALASTFETRGAIENRALETIVIGLANPFVPDDRVDVEEVKQPASKRASKQASNQASRPPVIKLSRFSRHRRQLFALRTFFHPPATSSASAGARIISDPPLEQIEKGAGEQPAAETPPTASPFVETLTCTGCETDSCG